MIDENHFCLYHLYFETNPGRHSTRAADNAILYRIVHTAIRFELKGKV